MCLFQMGQRGEAELLCRRAVNMIKRRHGENHANYALALERLEIVSGGRRNVEQLT